MAWLSWVLSNIKHYTFHSIFKFSIFGTKASPPYAQDPGVGWGGDSENKSFSKLNTSNLSIVCKLSLLYVLPRLHDLLCVIFDTNIAIIMNKWLPSSISAILALLYLTLMGKNHFDNDLLNNCHKEKHEKFYHFVRFLKHLKTFKWGLL